MNGWKKGLCIVLATKESLDILVRHGQEVAYEDGTFNLDFNPKIQVVAMVVSHKVAKKVIF